jgi:IS1 family transposase/transposase-like protein
MFVGNAILFFDILAIIYYFSFMINNQCPECFSPNFKRDGHTRHGKQNYQCKNCGRNFSEDATQAPIPQWKREQAKLLLLERISIRGIARVLKISPASVLNILAEEGAELPDDLNFESLKVGNNVEIFNVDMNADEMWSFVGKKENVQWLWIALDVETRQVAAFEVGDRSEKTARRLWEKIPEGLRREAYFFTDFWRPYMAVIPEERHLPVGKETGFTSYVERFNCTLRQRCSRLVRKTLSFSKKLRNHILAIKLFICHYNACINEKVYEYA